MSSAASLQTVDAKAKPPSNSTHAGLLLQRKCACGAPTASLTGECAECKSRKRLQTKLTIGASNDPLEQEADRVADQVLAAPVNPAVSDTPPRIQRFTGHESGPADCAPASVDHALAGPGRPLEAALRQDMEQRFGYDFSRVQVHSGGPAERSARDVRAHAYTVGQSIVFAAGRFAPATDAGRRLLAHELTHVVQQSGSEGTRSGHSGAKIGRPPISLQQPEPGVALLQRRQDYDVTSITLTPPDAPITLAEAKQLATDQVTNGELTQVAIAGAKAGSEAEIMLWVILSQVGAKSQWSKEVDLVTSIGWPAKAGDPSPLGKVTVRVDDKGAATATLVSTGGVAVPTTYTKRADAEKALKASYGIASVTDGDAPWTVAELNLVVAAFKKLPATEIGALKGVDLRRVASLGDNAGRFEFKQSLDGETVTNEATLTLSNDVFPATQTNFTGGATDASAPSTLTVVHEVGHAVASKALRAATQAQLVAAAKANKAVDVNNAAFAASEAAKAEYEELKADPTAKPADVTAARTKAATANADAAAKYKTMNAAQAAAKGKRGAVTAATARSVLEGRLGTALTSAKTALAGAKAAATKFAATDLAPSVDYRTNCDGVATELDALGQGYKDLDADLNALITALDSAITARVDAHDALTASTSGDPGLAAYSAVDAAQDLCAEAAKALRDTGEQERSVFRFVEFVTAKKIEPFTKYASDNWPDKPEEFFAEAFSLYLSDPEYLKSNAKDLHAWFAAGEHRK